jgi:hypothetical protein
MKPLSRVSSLILFLAILLLCSCSTQKETLVNKPYEIKHWLTLQKYPCFGHCQVVKLSVYRNGLVIYEGKENVEKKGVYFSELSNSVFTLRNSAVKKLINSKGSVMRSTGQNSTMNTW